MISTAVATGLNPLLRKTFCVQRTAAFSVVHLPAGNSVSAAASTPISAAQKAAKMINTAKSGGAKGAYKSGGAKTGNTDDIPGMRKLKLLALHGYDQTANVFSRVNKRLTGDAKKKGRLDSVAEVVYAEGPHTVASEKGGKSWFEADYLDGLVCAQCTDSTCPYQLCACTAQTELIYIGWEESLQYLAALSAEKG